MVVFLGAKHANSVSSPTFRMIADAYDRFDFDVVVVEGFPTENGRNHPHLISYARDAVEEDRFVSRGEIVPAVLGAISNDADALGGEPTDLEIRAELAANGVSDEDLLGFYTLRTIPQWIRERRITDAGDPAVSVLLTEELARNRKRLRIGADILPENAAFLVWYERKNGKPLGTDFKLEEVGPLMDGEYATNKIAAAISRARAVHLHRLITNLVNGGESVLVVFGGSHLMIHRPALDAVLGAPCYFGDDLTEHKCGD